MSLSDLIQKLKRVLQRPASLPDPATRPAPAPKPIPVPGGVASPPAGFDIDVILLTDDVRRSHGRQPLVWNGPLETMAQKWAVSLAAGLAASPHAGFKGRLVQSVGDVAGAENMAIGQATPSEVVKAWQASAGHLANILGDFTHTGVGAAVGADGKIYWVMDFAKLSK